MSRDMKNIKFSEPNPVAEPDPVTEPNQAKLQQTRILLPFLQRLMCACNDQPSSMIFEMNRFILELVDNVDLHNDTLQKTVLEFCKVALRHKFPNFVINLYYRFYLNGIDLTENGSQLEVVGNRLECINIILDSILHDSLSSSLDAQALYGFAVAMNKKIEAVPFTSIHFSSEEARNKACGEYEIRAINNIALMESVELLLEIRRNNRPTPEPTKTIQEQYNESIADEVYERDLLHSLTYLVEPLDYFPVLDKTFGYSANEGELLQAMLLSNCGADDTANICRDNEEELVISRRSRKSNKSGERVRRF